MQGEGNETIERLARGDLDGAPLDADEKELLRLVEIITRDARRTSAGDVQRARGAGWSDDQIAEAVYITALFAMFNRVSDAFGLEDPKYREMAAQGQAPPPPAERGQPEE